MITLPNNRTPILENIEHLKGLQLSPEKDLIIQVYLNDATNLFNILIAKQIPFNVIFYDSQKQLQPDQINPDKTVISPTFVSTNDNEFIKKIHQKYFVRDWESPIPNIDTIANEFGINPLTLKTQFKAKIGKSFFQCYKEKRMEQGAYLLRQGYRAVDVSKRLGYTHPIKFSKMFQKYFGITPKKYQVQNFILK